MPTTLESKPTSPPDSPRRMRTSIDEQRRGVRLLIVSVLLAGAMFALWWLVATTNREGHHDAELLPLFTLFTLVPAVYHLALAKYLRSRGK